MVERNTNQENPIHHNCSNATLLHHFLNHRINSQTANLSSDFGIDVNLQDKWLVNFDVKKIWFSADVFLNPSTKIDSLDIDPWVVSFGVGKKF